MWGTRHKPLAELELQLLKWQCRKVEAFIFVASTGRSGTNSLADIFSGIPGCIALHEPRPPMVTKAEIRSNPLPYFDREFRESKHKAILRSARKCRLYLETTHQFIKNFAPQAVELLGDRIRVIHLWRDPTSVATSFYAIGSVPGRTEKGITWLLDPSRVDNCLPIADVLQNDPAFAHDFFRCLWYWYETEARVRRFARNFAHVRLSHVHTSELNNATAVDRLLRDIGLGQYSSHISRRAGAHSNQKTDVKTRHVTPGQADEMHAQLEALLVQRFGADITSYLSSIPS